MVKFIVLSTQRSGSSFLGTLLSSHPDIKCFEEVFMPKNEHDIAFRAYRSASISRKMRYAFGRQKLIFQFLDELLLREPDVSAVGFKFMYRQAQRHPDVVEWCRQNDVHVVHLIRRNLLKIVVSRVLAKQRGVYHSKQALEASKVRLDAGTLVSTLDSMADLIRRNAQAFSANPSIEVHYEDFVANQGTETDRILQFLGVARNEPLTSDLVKINTDKLADLVDNYAAVAKSLEGTPYEQMLHA